MRGAVPFTFVSCFQDDLADILASIEKLMHRDFFIETCWGGGHSWECSIEIDLMEVCCLVMNWTEFAHNESLGIFLWKRYIH